MPPNNTPCTRSLTCKSHSMALKRGVLGRSQSYDILLAQYQKKSIGRPQSKFTLSMHFTFKYYINLFCILKIMVCQIISKTIRRKMEK